MTAAQPGPPAEPESAALPRPRWGVPDAVAWLAAAFGLALLASVAAGAAGVRGTGLVVAALLAGWLGLAGGPVWVARRKGNGLRRDFALAFTWSDVGWGVIGAAAMLVLAAVYLAVLVLLGGQVPTSAVGEVAAEAGRGWLPVLAVLVAFGAPIVEELHFRGLWWGALRKRGLSPWVAVAVTAAVFAAFHFEPTRFPLLFTSGLVLGALRAATQRLGASIVAHGINNLLGALGLLALG